MICRYFVGLVAITVLQACSTTSVPEATSATIVEDTAETRCISHETRPESVDCYRCKELIQAQTRVTELFISNLHRRLADLEDEAKCCRPYNSDPNAPMIEESLIQDIRKIRETIKRHQANLEKLQSDCPEQLRTPDSVLIADSSRRPGSQ